MLGPIAGRAKEGRVVLLKEVTDATDMRSATVEDGPSAEADAGAQIVKEPCTHFG